MSPLHKKMLAALHNAINSYAEISAETFSSLAGICKPVSLKKADFFTRQGDIPDTFAFLYSGLMRAFTTNEKSDEYNKNFFTENSFPGSMVALLNSAPSEFTIEALEETNLILINFRHYRELLVQSDELKWFQINYLEQNWLIGKEKREVEFAQDNALDRYQNFINSNPDLAKRLTQYHIASHLGITPTQLSRIRKKISSNQHM